MQKVKAQTNMNSTQTETVEVNSEPIAVTLPAPRIVKEQPEAGMDFLRFQIGVNVSRPALVAAYAGRRFIGSVTAPSPVQVFKLLGFGSTLAKAEMKAAKQRL
jgi:hypothetical protein